MEWGCFEKSLMDLASLTWCRDSIHGSVTLSWLDLTQEWIFVIDLEFKVLPQ